MEIRCISSLSIGPITCGGVDTPQRNNNNKLNVCVAEVDVVRLHVVKVQKWIDFMILKINCTRHAISIGKAINEQMQTN